MQLLRLSSSSLQFEYVQGAYLNQILILTNVSPSPIAFKFKATNPEVFLLRPPSGLLQPNQEMTINVTLHHKVFEKGVKNFNEKLLIISDIATNTSIPEAVFADKSRQFHEQKISIVILKGSEIMCSSQQNNSLFESMQKQSFGGSASRIVILPTPQESRTQGSYFQNKIEQLQLELQLKEQQLKQCNADIQTYKSKTGKDHQGNTGSFLLIVVLFFLSFTLGLQARMK